VEAIDEVTYGRLFLGLGLAIVALQIVAMGIARRRRATGTVSFRPQALAGAAILVLPAFAGISMHAARAMTLKAFEALEPAEKATALSAGLSGQLNVIPFATTATVVALLLWLPGLKMTMDARAPGVAARGVSPFLLIALGLISMVVGIWQWSLAVIRGFAPPPEVTPEARVTVLLRALDFARAHLEIFARMSRWTIVGLTAIALAQIVFDKRPLSARAGRRFLVASLAAVLLAAALVLAAAPLRAENDLPWPAPATGDALLVTEPAAPDLEGPDPVERAPVVQVFADQILLDGSATPLESLDGPLGTLHNNFALLNPGATFDPYVVILAAGATAIPRLVSLLRAAHGGGYSKVLFAFVRAEVVVRPTFGRLSRVHATGALVSVVDALDLELGDGPGPDAVYVRLEDFRSYDALARRLVDLRRGGRAPALDLGK
jgi:hypothetical protein